jgi:hypothetical protein
MSKVRLVVRIPGSLRGRIDDTARDREETLSEFARKVFERFFLAMDAANPQPREVKKR